MKSTEKFVRDREFSLKESPLTLLFKAEDFRSVYNLFFIILLSLIFLKIHQYIYVHEEFSKELEVLVEIFQTLYLAIFFSFVLQVILLLTFYPLVKLWIKYRINSLYKNFYDKGIYLYTTIFNLALYYTTFKLLNIFDCSLATKMAMALEQSRLSMKIISFMVESKRYSDNIKSEDNLVKEANKIASIRKFIYFLFAPTLLYRSSYPRTQKTNWTKVFSYLLQFFLSWLFFSLCFLQFMHKNISTVDLKSLTFQSLSYIFLVSYVTSIMLILLCFYAFLHCWLNAWAEILRFGDRQFYYDWWNSTSYTQFYRKWNTCVHDWIHSYIYRSLVKELDLNRYLSGFIVIFISAAVHEFVLTATFGYFFPILFILFAIFGAIYFLIEPLLKSKINGCIGNIHFLWSLSTGFSIIAITIFFEYFARKTCPYETKLKREIYRNLKE